MKKARLNLNQKLKVFGARLVSTNHYLQQHPAQQQTSNLDGIQCSAKNRDIRQKRGNVRWNGSVNTSKIRQQKSSELS